jgi:hypothetical protein
MSYVTFIPVGFKKLHLSDCEVEYDFMIESNNIVNFPVEALANMTVEPRSYDNIETEFDYFHVTIGDNSWDFTTDPREGLMNNSILKVKENHENSSTG